MRHRASQPIARVLDVPLYCTGRREDGPARLYPLDAGGRLQIEVRIESKWFIWIVTEQRRGPPELGNSQFCYSSKSV